MSLGLLTEAPLGSAEAKLLAEFALLIGKTAEPEFLQFVIYKAMTFSDEIRAIDSCKAYSSGPVRTCVKAVISPVIMWVPGSLRGGGHCYGSRHIAKGSA